SETGAQKARRPARASRFRSLDFLIEDARTEVDHPAGSDSGTTQRSTKQSCPSIGCSLSRLLVDDTLDVKLHRPALLFCRILQAALDALRQVLGLELPLAERKSGRQGFVAAFTMTPGTALDEQLLASGDQPITLVCTDLRMNRPRRGCRTVR